MKNVKLLSGMLAMALACGLAVPAFAADVSTAGGTGNVPVELTVETPTFSVTVPTSLPVSLKADGSVVTSNSVKIVNNSYGAVKVTNMTIAGADGWATVDYDTANMSAEKVDSKKIAMKINNDKTTGANAISFTSSNFPKMDGVNASTSDELSITYDAKIPAQSAQLTVAKTICNVIFTVGWDA